MPSDLAVNVPCTSSEAFRGRRRPAVLAGGRLLDHFAGDPLPRHADVLHAEVVVGPHVKHELLGIEHDATSRQVFARHLRRLVVLGRDRDLERLLAREAELVLPLSSASRESSMSTSGVVNESPFDMHD